MYYSLDISISNLYEYEFLFKSILLNKRDDLNMQQHNIGTGFRFILLRQYISLSLRHNTYNIMTRQTFDTIGIHLFYDMFTMVTYNHNNLFVEVYNLYTFLYHMGRCSGTFLTFSRETLSTDSAALDYYLTNAIGRRKFFNDRLYVDRQNLIKVSLNTIIDSNFDFLLIIDSKMSEGVVAKMRDMPMQVIGLSTNVLWARYIDTVIPLDSSSLELQQFFMEMCLYAYLSGTRDIRFDNYINISSIACSLLI